MADCHLAALDHCEREHASHSVPIGLGLCGIVHRVVRQRDGFTNALLDGPGLAFEAPDTLDGDSGGVLTGLVPAHAVHHEEDPARVVGVDPILVVRAHRSLVACGG